MTSPVGIPWWKSRTMVAAYVGLLIAMVDVISTVMLQEHLSWRTAVIAVGSAIAAWGRKNASAIVVSWLGLDVAVDDPEGPKP